MAYFVKINSDNIVETITVISNCAIGSCIGKEHWDYQEEYHKDHDKGIDFPKSEILGQKVLADSGFEGKWLQTSYNGKFRGRFAGVGMTYDKDKDEFVVPETPADLSIANG
jgi:hypothetical protein